MIDREQVHKVAHLARLDLTAGEEEQFTTQLNGILDYFEQLNELDTTNVEILERAPDRETNLQGDFFKVPKIM
jgi:aspartyl-tRNA(Asn)/glutamyl-tRNA(Gln) amidotransferase subunit C